MSIYKGTDLVAGAVVTANAANQDLSNLTATGESHFIKPSDCVACHVVVETYVNGTEWYRVYSDGWIEQGGVVTGITYSSPKTISFSKAFSDTNYTLNATCKLSSNAYVNANTVLQVYSYSNSEARIYHPSSSAIGAFWYACGY